MTNVGPAFAHPALARVAASPQMLTLHQAATAIGAADPLIALRYIDCSPEAIAALAGQVQNGTQAVGTAHATFSRSRSEADSAWTGQAADAFDQQAYALDGYYSAVSAASEKTGDAGVNIAQNLSDLATSVANKSANIATQVYPVSYLVAGGDRTPTNVQIVNNACRDIATLVQAADAEIPTIAAALNGLTTPTPDASDSGAREVHDRASGQGSGSSTGEAAGKSAAGEVAGASAGEAAGSAAAGEAAGTSTAGQSAGEAAGQAAGSSSAGEAAGTSAAGAAGEAAGTSSLGEAAGTSAAGEAAGMSAGEAAGQAGGTSSAGQAAGSAAAGEAAGTSTAGQSASEAAGHAAGSSSAGEAAGSAAAGR